jgi:hypothetical protein
VDYYPGVWRKLQRTDDEPRPQSFYESLGNADIRDGGPMRAFVRFDIWPTTRHLLFAAGCADPPFHDQSWHGLARLLD